MSNEVNTTIELYPSNWLYNAGVIGFLRVLKECGENVENWLKDDGSVEIKKDIFKGLKDHVNRLYFSDNKIASIVGNSQIYRNYFQYKWNKDDFIQFVQTLNTVRQGLLCGICGDGFYIPNNELQNLSDTIKNKFLPGIRSFDVRLNNYLAPSKQFPNSFWNNHTSLQVCDLCGYILIHHHLALTQLSDSSEIFINAPSFKVMWYLNKFAQDVLSSNKNYKVREILGMSYIEFAQKLSITLGLWSMMNIEMVIKKDDKIDYYSLPFEITRVLLKKDIAALISEAREPLILELILSGNFEMLLILTHKILRYSFTTKDANKDKYLSRLRNKDAKDLQRLSMILPELYTKINSLHKEVLL